MDGPLCYERVSQSWEEILIWELTGSRNKKNIQTSWINHRRWIDENKLGPGY